MEAERTPCHMPPITEDTRQKCHALSHLIIIIIIMASFHYHYHAICCMCMCVCRWRRAGSVQRVRRSVWWVGVRCRPKCEGGEGEGRRRGDRRMRLSFSKPRHHHHELTSPLHSKIHNSLPAPSTHHSTPTPPLPPPASPSRRRCLMKAALSADFHSERAFLIGTLPSPSCLFLISHHTACFLPDAFSPSP